VIAGPSRIGHCGFLALLTTWLLVAEGLLAAEPAPSATGLSTVVAATVGKESVFASEVAQLLEDSGADKRATPVALPRLQAEALEQVVNRRLVAQLLARQGYEPAADQVDELLAELKQRLATQQLTFAEFLKRHDLTEALVRRQLSWDWAWNRYLEQQLTDAELEKYFNGHRREFDGSELRVSHILLKVENLDDAAAVVAAIKQAEQLRTEITGKKLSFAAAAEKYSAGPSRKQGGDLGFIPRHGAMAEAFSQAAFQLQPGDISKPVVTPFGVHLIQCTEVKPGQQKWQTQRRELAGAWSREQFLTLADAARRQTSIKYTGASPHFRSGTRELVLPGPNQ
jgi:parvulin-like peptidyl-prolyl isomerase